MTDATQAIFPVTPEQVDRQALAAYYQHPFVDNPRLAAEVLSDNWRSGASPAELALLDILARHRKAHSLPRDALRNAAQRALTILERNLHRQTEKCDDAVSILRAALTPSAVSADAGEGGAWPTALTQGLREILGIPNFQCGPMAHAYQKIGEFSGCDGLALEKRAEDEQAFILHKLLCFWFQHGDAWREPAIDEIDRAAKLARAASQQGTEP